MKTLFLSAATLLIVNQAYTGPAVAYNCLGKNKATEESVVFELMFSDHFREAVYTNQSITIVKKGWETLAAPVTPTKAGDIADSTVTVKADCGKAEDKLDVTAYCMHQY